MVSTQLIVTGRAGGGNSLIRSKDLPYPGPGEGFAEVDTPILQLTSTGAFQPPRKPKIRGICKSHNSCPNITNLAIEVDCSFMRKSDQ
jgi:hypothetical protein